jgi:DNA-binding MarR family transcriptional regulator
MSDAASTDAPKRLTLLYQLYLTQQASRQFMRRALAGSDMSGEEYALYSYLYANGPRTLSQAARDFGLPVTTLATMLGPLVESGEVERTPHPTDGRARLLGLTPAGREHLQQVIPAFSAAYRGRWRGAVRGAGRPAQRHPARQRPARVRGRLTPGTPGAYLRAQRPSAARRWGTRHGGDARSAT